MPKEPKRNLPNKETLPDEADQFAIEIAKRVGAIVGKEHQSKIVAQVLSVYRQERFSGPIAHPKHLREYEEILPGSADRIIKMAEGVVAHSARMQEKALDADIQDQKIGMRYGFAALLILIVCALITGLNGQTLIAGLFLGAGALGTIGTFVKGRFENGE